MDGSNNVVVHVTVVATRGRLFWFAQQQTFIVAANNN